MAERQLTLKPERIDSELESLPKAKAAFIEPMLLLRTGALPEAAQWLYELKLDGYRALANQQCRQGATPFAERQRFQCEVSGNRQSARISALRDSYRWRGRRAG
jgi:hypothetical protein